MQDRWKRSQAEENGNRKSCILGMGLEQFQVTLGDLDV